MVPSAGLCLSPPSFWQWHLEDQRCLAVVRSHCPTVHHNPMFVMASSVSCDYNTSSYTDNSAEHRQVVSTAPPKASVTESLVQFQKCGADNTVLCTQRVRYTSMYITECVWFQRKGTLSCHDSSYDLGIPKVRACWEELGKERKERALLEIEPHANVWYENKIF